MKKPEATYGIYNMPPEECKDEKFLLPSARVVQCRLIKLTDNDRIYMHILFTLDNGWEIHVAEYQHINTAQQAMYTSEIEKQTRMRLNMLFMVPIPPFINFDDYIGRVVDPNRPLVRQLKLRADALITQVKDASNANA